jgi:four helix bundle protein
MTEQTTVRMTPEVLEQRLVSFAVRVIPLANRLSTTFAGKHVAGQLLRSGTSAAPNYAEARSAESRADFIQKIRIAVKELNETSIWLRKTALVEGLAAECNELRRILGASLRTARVAAGNSQ